MRMIEWFIKLYENACPLHKLKELGTEEYKAFIGKRGNPVKMVSVRDHLEYMPQETLYFDFYNKARIFWLIPIDLPDGAIVGFVMRSLHGKQYSVYNGEYKKQVLYGFHDFGRYSPGMPIVLTEGVKDREYLAQFYPYVLACLSSSPSKASLSLLRALTNKVVLAFDHDDTGIKQAKRMKKTFEGLGAQAVVYLPDKSKDWGGYFTQEGLRGDAKLGLYETYPVIGNFIGKNKQ